MHFWKFVLLFQLQLGYPGLLQTGVEGAGRLCDGKNGCCAGYAWNEALQTCQKCAIGYYGADCEEPCLYPYYGENCNGNCDCIRQYCNISIGCLHQKSFSVGWELNHDGKTTHVIGISSDQSSNLSIPLPSNQTSYALYQHGIEFIIIVVSTGGLLFVAIVIMINCILYKRAVRRFYPVSIKEEHRTSVRSEFKENKNKIFEGNATMTMFYNKETDSYDVQIRTTNNQKPTGTQYLGAEETNREREVKPLYESLQDDMKLTLRTLSRCPDEPEIRNTSISNETESECDTTVKEVSVARHPSNNEHQHGDMSNQNVYLTIH